MDEKQQELIDYTADVLKETINTYLECFPQILTNVVVALPTLIETIVCFLQSFAQRLEDGEYDELIIQKAIEILNEEVKEDEE